MANPSARAGAEASSSSSRPLSSSSAAPKAKLTCLCSPTNHPGSFRCSRHRTRLSPRASQVAAAPAEGARGGASAGGRPKGRSVLRAHLLRLLSSSPPSSSSSCGRGHRCRDFKPRPSRLGLVDA
ncbi:uncharacterized protein LOC100829613 [Brachypodium distachyon]|uniref:Serine-rich protein n=1 Tax=Brachypodium distachyon TaxID=15368 RepID=I1IDJ4_BRADI|nr:uncharacterized protein LOC100829613 [Brachypodium distachyon]KQK01189.1 hypothetical protein BRADI_3g54330v3 [Brachypodium distachyon]|eukprot:XP_003572907.1 uncharacterized protein LOC100829613 [Brachypodium distachyon]